MSLTDIAKDAMSFTTNLLLMLSGVPSLVVDPTKSAFIVCVRFGYLMTTLNPFPKELS